MIYTTGTIAINGNTVTGTGTDFSAPLSLIRVGCTLIAVSDPIQIFTITEIKSGTELSVTPSANPAIHAGTKFSILLSDSISVDGLAQDVAETLRYYQGKESEIANAVEFFQEFDLDVLVALVNQVHTDSAQVSADKETSKQYKTDAESAKSAAEAAKDQAVLAQTAAETANTNAQAASTAAQVFRDQAEQFKNDIDPTKLLAKVNNLSDVADAAEARKNLRLGSTDNVTVNQLVTNDLIQAGRATWDGNSWGTKEVRASLLMLMPDGVSPPGMYVKPLGTEGGYPTRFVYDFVASAWTTPSQITAQNFTATKTKMGYTQLWSGALFRGPAWVADNGAENYQSLIGGAVGTDVHGFYGGVAFGMMTNGGEGWPIALISVGTSDRDAAGNMNSQTQFRFFSNGTISYSAGSSGSGSFQQVPASDRNLKHDIADDTSSTAYDNIKAMRFRTFVFNNDEQERQRRGVIAQELEEIDPLYVKHRTYHNEELNGPLVHKLELDTTPLLLDTMRALQDTIKQVEELKAEIAAMKQVEELKK